MDKNKGRGGSRGGVSWKSTLVHNIPLEARGGQNWVKFCPHSCWMPPKLFFIINNLMPNHRGLILVLYGPILLLVQKNLVASKSFWPRSIFFECGQIFLTMLRYSKVKYHFWPWSKNLNVLKRYWTWSKKFKHDQNIFELTDGIGIFGYLKHLQKFRNCSYGIDCWQNICCALEI